MAEVSREEQLAKEIAHAMNTICFNGKRFAERMEFEHRYLQNEFFLNVICEFIRYAGSDEYYYDGRNEYTHEMCKRLIPVLDEGVR